MHKGGQPVAPEPVFDVEALLPQLPVGDVASLPFFIAPDWIAVLVRVAPGAGVADHCHAHQDELFDILRGSGEARIGGRRSVLRPGVVLCVPAGTDHGLVAGPDGLLFRETVYRHVYARQAVWRALRKRWPWGAP